jgi:hypothetical protein
MLNLRGIVATSLKMVTGRYFSMSGINFILFQFWGKGGLSNILGGLKGVGFTIESYVKVEILYTNVDNF